MLLAILLIFGTLKLYSREEAQQKLDIKVGKLNHILHKFGITLINQQLVSSLQIPAEDLAKKGIEINNVFEMRLVSYVRTASATNLIELTTLLINSAGLPEKAVFNVKVAINTRATQFYLRKAASEATLPSPRQTERRILLSFLKGVGTSLIEIPRVATSENPSKKPVQRPVKLIK
eukprot:NODE_1282_length_1444_cov_0.254275.p1 type:complete len:176 gc:universal NODE_1282_length_1444_cov_0.254275:876-349(-)